MNLSSIGVQSYCFRGFKTIPELIEQVQSMGVKSIELCGVHVDFSNEASFASVIEKFKDAEIDISSVGVISLNKDGQAPNSAFQFAKAAGAQFVSINLPPDITDEGLEQAAQTANEFGVRLAIHNHGGRHWLGSKQHLGHILSRASQEIGLCLDTAWALDAGENPVAMATAFADRLYGVHIKDFVFDRARKHEDVIIGTGNLDLPAFFEELQKGGFSGYAVIEYEGDINNPVPALRECVAELKKHASAAPAEAVA